MSSVCPSKTSIKKYVTSATPQGLKLKLEKASPLVYSSTRVAVGCGSWLVLSKQHRLSVLTDFHKSKIAALMRTLSDDFFANRFRKNLSCYTILFIGNPEVLYLLAEVDGATFDEEIAAAKRFIRMSYTAEVDPSPLIYNLLSLLKDEITFRKFERYILSHPALSSYPKIVGIYVNLYDAYNKEEDIQETLQWCALLREENGSWVQNLEAKLSELESCNPYAAGETVTAVCEWLRVIDTFKKVLQEIKNSQTTTGIYKDFNKEIGVMFYYRHVLVHYVDHLTIDAEVTVTQVVQLMEYLTPTYLADFALMLYKNNLELYCRFFRVN